MHMVLGVRTGWSAFRCVQSDDHRGFGPGRDEFIALNHQDRRRVGQRILRRGDIFFLRMLSQGLRRVIADGLIGGKAQHPADGMYQVEAPGECLFTPRVA